MDADHHPETELVRRAKGGEVAAFERLYRLYVDRVHGLCLRMVADRGRAEELTQEAFVRAWKKLGSFRGDSTFSTWLHRLAVNVVLGSERSRHRWTARFITPWETARDSHIQPRQHHEKRIDLERAIRDLPTRARLVFILHDIQGFSHGEIATLTGMATGTSKAHLHRARQLLREALGR